jgi:serine/threonine protein kinase
MLDRYRNFTPVRGGGFADVYRAIEIQSGMAVAVKFLRDRSPENRRRFRRERDLLIRHANNPYVVTLLDSDLETEWPYLVLEFAEAGALQYYVSNRRPWERIAKWLCQIARGLELMHPKGEWHRDIKPNNLLLYKYTNGEEIVRLTDFGLAQKPSNNNSSMTCSPYGTPGYIDPAAIQTGIYTWESDIYSLGVTMRELLTGSKEKSWFRSLPGPYEFRQLIGWMCDPDPNKRPDATYIYQTVERLLWPPVPVPTTVPQTSGLDTALKILKGIEVAANILGSANRWDKNVKRFRNSKGQFQSGWLNYEKVNHILSQSVCT